MAGKMRSPNYPALSLPQALEAVRKLWDAEKRTAVSHETAAQAMGYSSLSGPARVAIGALRQYALIDKAEAGHIRVSQLALSALHGESTERTAAIATAAGTPELFRELMASHMEASENAIRSYLLTKKGFADDGARKAAKAFRETMALAGMPEKGYNPVQTQEKPEAMAGIESVQSAGSRPPDGPGILSLKVPYGAGALAVEIRVTGEPLKRAHIERVRKYLELAESDLQNGD